MGAVERVDSAGLALVARLRDRSSGGVDRAVTRFSATGEHAACWLVLGTLGTLLDRRRRARWRRSTLFVGGAYLANTAIKALIGRQRPTQLEPLTSTPTQLSFPSAHATSSFTAARAFSGLLPAPPLYAVAAALALSRVYVGVHYPSDIAAGAVLGTAIGGFAR